MMTRKSKSAPLVGPKNPPVWQIYGIGAIVCLALTAGAYLFGVQPALATRESGEVHAADLQSRRQNATDLAGTLIATRQKLEQTRREVAGLSLQLEPAASVNQRLAKLADLAATVGLEINEVQPGTATNSPHYQVVPIRISGTGTYPACARFLHELRDRFPDTAARSIEAANPAPTRDHPTGTFRFELNWFTAPVNSKMGHK